jgi:hypothetical protein
MGSHDNDPRGYSKTDAQGNWVTHNPSDHFPGGTYTSYGNSSGHFTVVNDASGRCVKFSGGDNAAARLIASFLNNKRS